LLLFSGAALQTYTPNSAPLDRALGFEHVEKATADCSHINVLDTVPESFRDDTQQDVWRNNA
jgi:hypothetical protein